MKWGRITYASACTSHSVCNIGDIAQTFAVDIIYKKMHIDTKDIIDIPVDKIHTYKGEKIILPMAGYFRYSREYPVFPVSEDIIPVFLSIYCTSKQYLKRNYFWEKYGPIGCRDENTMSAMRKYGYEAYLLGCMTMLFPKRKCNPITPHIFLVDVYPKAISYIPKELMQFTEYVTHDIAIDKNESRDMLTKTMQKRAMEIYSRYEKEATLIITSRLHCAVPCIAMGIPTIIVKNGFDERFGWLDKIIPLYTPDEFDKIDWNPQPIDLENHKRRLLNNAIKMLNRQSSTNDLEDIHSFYMDRTRKKLHTPLLVAGYSWLAQYYPGLAGFLREKILKSFSILSKPDSR